MRLALLAADRKLARLMSQLEDHKRCQLLISENKIARVHQLLAVQLLRGETPQRIAEQLQAAINGSYVASGNKDDDEFRQSAARAPRRPSAAYDARRDRRLRHCTRVRLVLLRFLLLSCRAISLPLSL